MLKKKLKKFSDTTSVMIIPILKFFFKHLHSLSWTHWATKDKFELTFPIYPPPQIWLYRHVPQFQDVFFPSEAGKHPIKALFFLLGVFLDNEDDECPQLVLINPLSDSLFYPIPFLVEWFSQAQVRVLLSALNSSHQSLHHFTVPLHNTSTYVSSLLGNSFHRPQF